MKFFPMNRILRLKFVDEPKIPEGMEIRRRSVGIRSWGEMTAKNDRMDDEMTMG